MRLLPCLMILSACLLLLSACGQKGPLYLPTDVQTLHSNS